MCFITTLPDAIRRNPSPVLLKKKVSDENTYHQGGEHGCFLESHYFRFRVCCPVCVFHELRARLNRSDKWLNYTRSRVIYIRAVPPSVFDPSDLLTQVIRGRSTCHRHADGRVNIMTLTSRVSVCTRGSARVENTIYSHETPKLRLIFSDFLIYRHSLSGQYYQPS